MRKLLWLIVCLMTMVVSANAQNAIVDEFKTNEPTKKGYEYLLLDPNKSISENYAKIDSLMKLHKEISYAEYIIMPHGYYTNKRGDAYKWPIGIIKVKGKDNERYRTISGQIINVLTDLYSYSLDTPFNVESDNYHTMSVNEKSVKVKVETGKTFRHNDGKITKEYVEKEKKVGGNTLYCLYSTSALYKKIYNKVIEETGLKDGGILYDLEHRRNNTSIRNFKIYHVDTIHQEIEHVAKEVAPTKNKKFNRSNNDDMYYQK